MAVAYREGIMLVKAAVCFYLQETLIHRQWTIPLRASSLVAALAAPPKSNPPQRITAERWSVTSSPFVLILKSPDHCAKQNALHAVAGQPHLLEWVLPIKYNMRYHFCTKWLVLDVIAEKFGWLLCSPFGSPLIISYNPYRVVSLRSMCSRQATRTFIWLILQTSIKFKWHFLLLSVPWIAGNQKNPPHLKQKMGSHSVIPKKYSTILKKQVHIPGRY